MMLIPFSIAIGALDCLQRRRKVSQICDWLEATGICLGNHTYLKQLGFVNLLGINRYSFSALYKGLVRNSSISKIILTSESIFDDSYYIDALGPVFQNITQLAFLPEKGEYQPYRPMELDPKGILCIALMLTKFSSLKKAELVELCSGEKLNDELISHVCNALGTCHPGLTAIKLSGIIIGKMQEIY